MHTPHSIPFHSIRYIHLTHEISAGRSQNASKDITIHQLRYKIRALDLDPQFQTGIPIKVMVSVTYQNDKPVNVNDANKEIVISKIPNSKNLSETYTKHELTNNGTALVSIPTSKTDESGFVLKVRIPHSQQYHIFGCVCVCIYAIHRVI